MHTTMHKKTSRPRELTPQAKIMRTLQKQGLKLTRQRKVILEVFLDMDGHPSPEEIHREIHRQGHNLGISTVYRTLKVLVETGVVRKLEFGDGQGRYEQRDERTQHLHLVCKQCGQTFEVPTIAVDWLFEELAENHAFALHSHTAYLYGLCDACIAESSENRDNHEEERITP
ncbi:Fur family transcriptional regulator [uncultured Pseudodesulfovibrio sp.]|uniref:Fur family transcriptional regulator n=1 Tax=uncultured Pseudodesulfovibrio sp. TaxID=2035858 RepID=UPI0029C7A314|nr:Fur family transcriptional regulator [uncultured Pseudodesulfovibrio sp.]